MGIYIPNMERPKECWECPCENDSDCQALELLEGDSRSYEVPFHGVRPDCPLIEIEEWNSYSNGKMYALKGTFQKIIDDEVE